MHVPYLTVSLKSAHYFVCCLSGCLKQSGGGGGSWERVRAGGRGLDRQPIKVIVFYCKSKVVTGESSLQA